MDVNIPGNEERGSANHINHKSIDFQSQSPLIVIPSLSLRQYCCANDFDQLTLYASLAG